MGTGTDQSLQGVDDGLSNAGSTASLPIGSTLLTTANLNLRTGPGTSYTIRTVMPAGASVTTINQTTPTNGFYQVKYAGLAGWASGNYLTESSPDGSVARQSAIARARAAVGYSYWWGHGRWVANGQSSGQVGSCTGNCPSCSHTGGYGADCSGYVAKVWQVPAANGDPTVDDHPYSTASFAVDSLQWKTISRGAVQAGDGFVYRSGGEGHVLVYEAGDGWGNLWAYEARGCATGITHDLRTVGTEYHAIARAGY